MTLDSRSVWTASCAPLPHSPPDPPVYPQVASVEAALSAIGHRVLTDLGLTTVASDRAVAIWTADALAALWRDL